jgi:hypothetical protein
MMYYNPTAAHIVELASFAAVAVGLAAGLLFAGYGFAEESEANRWQERWREAKAAWFKKLGVALEIAFTNAFACFTMCFLMFFVIIFPVTIGTLVLSWLGVL